MVITLRKFISVLVSILYFGHAFTVGHWTGTFMALGGGLLYAFVSSKKQKTE